MRPSLTSALVLIILTTVTFYSCEKVDRGQQTRTPKGDVRLGGLLKVAIPKGQTVFLPYTISDAGSSEVGQHLHDGLVRLDPLTLDVIPGIAERWSVDESGTIYVFNLRKGAKFHSDPCFGNGSREITAKDFEYSFKLLCDPANDQAYGTTFKSRVAGTEAFHAGTATDITGVTAIDDYTLKIELTKPDQSFLMILAQPSAAVVSEKAVSKYGDECKVGAGPFAFGTMENGITLIRNTEYYRQDAFGNRLPYLDSLSFLAVDTKEKQLELFFKGGLDLVSGLYLDPVRKVLEEHVSEFSGKSPSYVMQRETESVGYESYSVYCSEVKGFENNFVGYRDFTQVQIVN